MQVLQHEEQVDKDWALSETVVPGGPRPRRLKQRWKEAVEVAADGSLPQRAEFTAGELDRYLDRLRARVVEDLGAAKRNVVSIYPDEYEPFQVRTQLESEKMRLIRFKIRLLLSSLTFDLRPVRCTCRATTRRLLGDCRPSPTTSWRSPTSTLCWTGCTTYTTGTHTGGVIQSDGSRVLYGVTDFEHFRFDQKSCWWAVNDLSGRSVKPRHTESSRHINELT